MPSYKARQGNESGGNIEESPGREVQLVWACDVKRRALWRDRNGSTREKEEEKEDGLTMRGMI